MIYSFICHCINEINLVFIIMQVFYAGSAESNCVFLYWVLDNEVQLTWVKFQMLNYVLTDACLCPGMSKLVTGTTRGRILLFNAKIKGQIVNSQSPIKEHSETNLMVKVAHEVINSF